MLAWLGLFLLLQAHLAFPFTHAPTCWTEVPRILDWRVLSSLGVSLAVLASFYQNRLDKQCLFCTIVSLCATDYMSSFFCPCVIDTLTFGNACRLRGFIINAAVYGLRCCVQS